MKTVWKFPLKVIDGPQVVSMPLGARALKVDLDPAIDGEIAIWAEVFPAAQASRHEFVVHGTGHPIEVDDRYVGTAMINGFVWHVYEVAR